MSNIPKYLREVSEIKKEREELINKINVLDEKINKLHKLWQDECTHPVEYMDNNICAACGYKEEIIEEGEVI
jgi:hypothetical protein